LDEYSERALLILEISADDTILAANALARQLLGPDLEGKQLKEVFLDFRGERQLSKLAAEGDLPHLINVAIAGSIPATLYVHLFPMAGRVIAVGEMNWVEVITLRRELVRANNDLNNRTRELHKKNAELVRLNEFKDQVLGMVSHDLRTPLTAITGYCEFILQGSENHLRPEFADILQEVCNQSSFMLLLIDDLLDFAAMEMGRPNIKRVPGDFSKLLRRAVKIHRPMAERKGIELLLEDHLPPGEVSYDASKITQVLNNLISNAIKFSGMGTQVIMTAAIEDGDLVFWVKDQGPGIPHDEMPCLFKPFARISIKATDGERSTGLGLAISQRIITAHQGRIWAESEPGSGSRFSFSIPLHPSEHRSE
jgi:signal transduction histidine kinase